MRMRRVLALCLLLFGVAAAARSAPRVLQEQGSPPPRKFVFADINRTEYFAIIPWLIGELFACSPVAQRASLEFFYLITEGSDWRDSTGWPALPTLTNPIGSGAIRNVEAEYHVVRRMNATDPVSGQCKVRLDARASSHHLWMMDAWENNRSSLSEPVDLDDVQWEIGEDGMVHIVQPDHCCWKGVTCCLYTRRCDGIELGCTQCTSGSLLSLLLPTNNLAGNFGSMDLGLKDPDAASFMRALSCDIAELQLQNNQLTGSIPIALQSAKGLNSLVLSDNSISGTIPPLHRLSNLYELSLHSNRLNGTVPQVCSDSGSPMRVLDLSHNELSGAANFGSCQHLATLKMNDNNLTSLNVSRLVLVGRGMRALRVLSLSNNDLKDFNLSVVWEDSFPLVEVVDLGNSNIGGNLLDVTRLFSQEHLKSLNVRACDLTGKVPDDMFEDFGLLEEIDLSANRLIGDLPSHGYSPLLYSVEVKDNPLTGIIPAELASVLAGQPGTRLDIVGTWMSCCGRGNVSVNDDGDVAFESIDWEAPRLPPTLKTSDTAFFATDEGNMLCPHLLPAEADDIPESLLLNWKVDPAYTLYSGCKCVDGFEQVNMSTATMAKMTCRSTKLDLLWLWIILGFFAVVASIALLLWLVPSARTQYLQTLLNDRKRQRPEPPPGSEISIVVTDIQDYSKFSDREMIELLKAKKEIMDKAKSSNFGYELESEGDSYCFAFYSPSDAVSFCIQAQLMMKEQEPEQASGPSRLRMASLLRWGSSEIWSKKSGSTTDRLPSSQFPSLDATRMQDQDINVRQLRDVSMQPQHSSVTLQVMRDLTVRLGVATGKTEAHVPIRNSNVMRLAKVIMDLTPGGLTYVCPTTFSAVKDRAVDLGHVSEDGPPLVPSSNLTRFVQSWSQMQQLQNSAAVTFMHMGEHENTQANFGHGFSRSASYMDSIEFYQVEHASQRVQGRDIIYNNSNTAATTWEATSLSFYQAPGVQQHLAGDEYPVMAFAFLQLDNPPMQRMHNIHVKLLHQIRRVLRLFPGGYLVKDIATDYRFMLVFKSGYVALMFLAEVQERVATMGWTSDEAALWDQQQDADGRPLRSGPPLKMGMALGRPEEIALSTSGKADYFGSAVNLAARLGMAVARGDQIIISRTHVEQLCKGTPGAYDALDASFGDFADAEDTKVAVTVFGEVLEEKKKTRAVTYKPPVPPTRPAWFLSPSGDVHQSGSSSASVMMWDTKLASHVHSATLYHMQPWLDNVLETRDLQSLYVTDAGGFKVKGSTETFEVANVGLRHRTSAAYPEAAALGKSKRQRNPTHDLLAMIRLPKLADEHGSAPIASPPPAKRPPKMPPIPTSPFQNVAGSASTSSTSPHRKESSAGQQSTSIQDSNASRTLSFETSV